MSIEKAKARKLKIVLVGDIHMGPNIEYKPGEETPNLMTQFVELVNQEIKPDLVLELGDRVNNRSHEADLSNAKKLNSILKGLAAPCCFVIGNHDVLHLSKEENNAIFGGELTYRAKTVKGYKLVFLDTTEPVIEEVGGNVSERQLEWLKAELQDGGGPKIVLGHHPLDDQSLSGNPHFVRFPEYAYVKNRNEVRRALAAGRNVLAYINAHVHWFNFIVARASLFVSVPSFTEAWPETKNAPGLFAEAVLADDGLVELAVRSMNPKRTLGRFNWRGVANWAAHDTGFDTAAVGGG